MIYLIISIVTTASLYVIFKVFEKIRINTFLALVVNYITASTIGFAINSYHPEVSIMHERWFWWAVCTGILLICVLYMMAYTTQHIGISVSSVSNKMSLVIPFLLMIYLKLDVITPLKTGGIVLAVLAIWFTASRNEENDPEGVVHTQKTLKFLLPVLLFIGSGLVDSLLSMSQMFFLREDNLDLFMAVVFGSAAISGCIVLLIKRTSVERKGLSVLSGVLFGLVNYLSIFSFMNSLDKSPLPQSVIIPVNNIAVLTLSAIAALVIFKERFSAKNLIGLALSLLAVCLLKFS